MLRPSQGLRLEMPLHFRQLSRELPAAQLNIGPSNTERKIIGRLGNLNKKI